MLLLTPPPSIMKSLHPTHKIDFSSRCFIYASWKGVCQSTAFIATSRTSLRLHTSHLIQKRAKACYHCDNSGHPIRDCIKRETVTIGDKRSRIDKSTENNFPKSNASPSILKDYAEATATSIPFSTYEVFCTVVSPLKKSM